MINTKLLGIVENFVNDKYPIEKFLEEYESTFLDEQDTLSSEVNDIIFSKYDEIFMCIDRYEPNPDIRKESNNYIGESDLKKEVNKLYQELLSIKTENDKL